MSLDVPPVNGDGSLRYYTEPELDDIDLQQRGTGEEHDHVRDEMSPGGSGSHRRYSCAWAERYAAALVLVGACKSYTDGDGKARISRLIPDCHPGRRDFNWVCTGAQIDPFEYSGDIDAVDFGQPMPRFIRADLTATYELVPYGLYDDDETTAAQEYTRYVTKPGHVGAEITAQPNYLGLPGSVLQYATATGIGTPAKNPIPFAVGFVETYTSKKMVWRRIPEDLWGPGTVLQTRIKGDGGANRGYIGAMNLTEFFGNPPLTLKFDGVEEKLLPDPTGLGYAWDLTYLFQEKMVPFGHTGMYYHDPSGSGLSGYYQGLRPPRVTYLTAAQLALAGDEAALFTVREFADLFFVGAV